MCWPQASKSPPRHRSQIKSVCGQRLADSAQAKRTIAARFPLFSVLQNPAARESPRVPHSVHVRKRKQNKQWAEEKHWRQDEAQPQKLNSSKCWRPSCSYSKHRLFWSPKAKAEAPAAQFAMIFGHLLCGPYCSTRGFVLAEKSGIKTLSDSSGMEDSPDIKACFSSSE